MFSLLLFFRLHRIVSALSIYPLPALFHSSLVAMVMMILWQVADSRISAAKDTWWQHRDTNAV